jgi:hypothetical protein
MGLDAVVYLKRELIQAPHPEALRLDEPTGEVYYAEEAGLRDDFVSEAIHIRFGNIAEIGGLRRELCATGGSLPIVCGKVVYSGSHTGDKIDVAEIDDLAHEIARLRMRTDLSSSAQLFLLRLDRLIAVSREQGNPIVF